jgi:hypothetical protein
VRAPPARAQFTPADGVDFCRRKVNLLRENVDKLGEARAPQRPRRSAWRER